MAVHFEETEMPLSNNNCGDYADKKLLHICEICGKTELLTPKEGFDQGWDYAPYMYPFKIISPRTCGSCAIDETAWFAIAIQHTPYEKLTDRQKDAIIRICNEPYSILPPDEQSHITSA